MSLKRPIRHAWPLGCTLLFLATGGALPAQQDAEQRPVVLRNPGRPAGIGQYREDTWGLVILDVVNRSERPAEVTGSLYFTHDSTLQFGRRLWLPARSRREAALLVRTPPGFAEGSRNFDFRTLLLEGDGSTEVLIPSSSGPNIDWGSLRVLPLPTITALIGDDDRESSPEVEMAWQAAVAARVAMNQHHHVAMFHDDFLPHSAAALNGLDQLVLAGDRLARDSAALSAVRRWLHDGGGLWIMLDRVTPETVALLLEDAWRCEVVDRVGLNAVELEGVARETQNVTREKTEYEEPVELVRVIPANVEEAFRVNGWPAAFWQRIGHGRVLFTTLEARAWIRKRPPGLRPHHHTLESDFVTTEPLFDLASEFVVPREPPEIEPAAWQSVLEDRIGYEILGRPAVFGVLGGFCAALTGAGWWLARRRRLDWIRWAAPGVAAAAAAALLVLAARTRQAVPSTLAVGQLAHVAPGSSDLSVSGLSAAYHQHPTSQPIRGTSGSVIWPDMAGLWGTRRRLMWTDLDRWHWEDLSLPAGVRTAWFQVPTKLERPLGARARFGPDGLEGELETGPFTTPADALIATPTGLRLAVTLKGGGRFSAAPADTQAPGEFVSSSLLSDEQLRRQRMYAQLFAADERIVERPTLFVWADPLAGGFEFPEAGRRDGSALLSIPLAIEPSPPETLVRIPAPFIGYRAGPAPGGFAFSSSYSNRTGRWQEKAGHQVNWLRFQMPEAVLPLRLERTRLRLHITGPAQRIELIAVAQGERVPFARRDDPVGTLEFDIERADLLELDRQGGLLLGVSIGVPPSEGVDEARVAAGFSSTADVRDRWKIGFLHLQAEGHTER